MDKQIFFPTISSSLFDTYLVYGIIGLLILIALVGLFVLLATSCCCCYCCLSPTSCCSSCYHTRRYSSYQLSKKTKHPGKLEKENSTRGAFIRRLPSDAADFSQLYDSYPHLINNKATTAAAAATATAGGMNTSCTTIDTIVNPISPCSSFRSIIEPGALPNNHHLSITQNDLSSPPPQNYPHIDKTNNAPLSSVKDLCSRPFSYIKNINDRAQILRRLTPQERSIPATAISLDVTRISSSSENDNHHQTHSNCTNIYEAVLPTTNSNINKMISTSDSSTPIYETEWTHNIQQLMIATSSIRDKGISVIGLPPIPPDLLPATKQSSDYFQQKNPYDKFLASRSTTSDSMRRANMLRRLKDDAAFLY